MSHVADASSNAAPSSPHLQATVQRAYGYAQDQGHRQVTPEHLLLALTEDADAIAVLERRAIDLDRLRHDVAGLMGRNNDRFARGEPGRPEYGADFRRVMGIAGAAASPRRPIDGALMLSALIADDATPAADIIKLFGLTFEDATRSSRPLRSAPLTPAPAPPPPAQPEAAPPSLANVRSSAREAALGYRLRKGPADDFVAVTAAEPGPVNGSARRFAEPPPLPQLWPEPAPAAEGEPGDSRSPPREDWDDGYTDAPPQRQPLTADRGGPAWPSPDPAPEPAGQPDWNSMGYPEPDAREPFPQQPEWSPAPPRRPAQRPPRQPDERRAGETAPVPKSKGRKSQGKPRRSQVDSGLLLENIPRRMVCKVSMSIEARFARRDIEAAIQDLHLPGHPSSQTPVTHAMTVRLRSPDGAMMVEPGAPETQWVENTLGLLQDDFSSWRWSVTPRWSGSTQLQLMVSVRAVTAHGLLGETALPDQMVGVAVVADYGSILARVALWVGAILVAGTAGAFGEYLAKILDRLLSH